MGRNSKEEDAAAAAERIKGPWSPEEDAALQRLVEKYGARKWSVISKGIPGRSGKSCRLRWCNQLSPQVEHHPFSPVEDATIIQAHARHGNKWATISRLLPGRTDNAIKNHWNSTLRRCSLADGHINNKPLLLSNDLTESKNNINDINFSRGKRSSSSRSRGGNEEGPEVESRGLKRQNSTESPENFDNNSSLESTGPEWSPDQIHRPVPRQSAFNFYEPLKIPEETSPADSASACSFDPLTSLSLSLPGSALSGENNIRESSTQQGQSYAPEPAQLLVNEQPCGYSFIPPSGYMKAEDAMSMMSAAAEMAVAEALPLIFRSSSGDLDTNFSGGLFSVMREMIAKEVKRVVKELQCSNLVGAGFNSVAPVLR